ncbi:TolC family protein [Rhodopirellula sp. JC740]|uniref:TolC family protein n=1 Tax=Rhodopirellula halodulae TaxID=2894198 RepID=A0ABS8NI11_9BACT|nr:TolC family protein [Rhodopirellula sp. JC740]MCC9643187.1 TolC family protein [Rhodopirellula sp. JC740]
MTADVKLFAAPLRTTPTRVLKVGLRTHRVSKLASIRSTWLKRLALSWLVCVGCCGAIDHQSAVAQTSVGVPSHQMHQNLELPIPNAVHSRPYEHHIDRYRSQVLDTPVTDGDESCWFENSPALAKPSILGGQVTVLDPKTVWWDQHVTTPLGLADQHTPVDASALAQTALIASPYVRGLLTEPQISMTDIVIADAQFDPLTFLDANYTDTNDPVGSTLTTGDASERFRDNLFSSSAGVRKKMTSGGNLELVQRGGFQNNNSTFLVPNPQGTSRLELNFSQPLLRDHGKAVNRTRVILAKIDAQITNSEVREEIQTHLLDVTTAYWELYQARAEWLQRSRLLESAQEMQGVLLARGEVDSQQRQILRANVAVAKRRADLVRIETRIRNAQSKLRLLTGDRQFAQFAEYEMVPVEKPLMQSIELSTRDATLTALDNRPDIVQSLQQMHAVSTRVGAARNQVLPRLDLLLSSYVAGLETGTNTFGAIGRQFSEGRPTYSAGLVFERPWGNRANQARLRRNRWEWTRSYAEFQQTTEAAITEVEIAVRETQTLFNELIAKQQSTNAAAREVEYLRSRWTLLPDPNENAILLIENLLDAQERLADEERSLVRSQVAHALSWVSLRKAMGVLLVCNVAEVSPPLNDLSVMTPPEPQPFGGMIESEPFSPPKPAEPTP